MNTMYREYKITGYQQVQKAIGYKEDMILDNVTHDDWPENFKPTDDEKKLSDALSKSALAMKDIKWSKDVAGKIELYLGYLNSAPKALLHVHSTVGLSVTYLMKEIKIWNSAPGRKDDLKIYHADVTLSNNKTINNMLMYKIQVDKLNDEAIAIANCGLADGTWLQKNTSSFFMERYEDINTNWEVFGEIFMRTEHLFRDMEFYKLYHKSFFIECMINNISYVELRTGFTEFTDWNKPKEIENGIVFLRPDFNMKEYFYHFDSLSSPNPLSPDVNFLQMILEAKKEAEEIYKNKKTIEVKVILTANRNKTMHNTEDTCKKIDTAIAIKNRVSSISDEIADMIVGFDFVNKEENTWGLTEELHNIMYDKFHCEGSNLTPKLRHLMEKSRMQLIRFFFHDGESTEIIGDCGSNAVTGPICSRHRIGHGFQMGAEKNFDTNNSRYGNHIVRYILNGHSNDIGLRNYPVQESVTSEGYSRKDYVIEPVIELCPISNYMLGYVDELQKHPAISLMEQGILAVICNDDPQLFYSQGLDHDYAMMYIALLNHFMKPNGVKKNVPDDVKQRAFKYLKISFFLGFFYKEMSKYYYKTIEEDDEEGKVAITMVNDDLDVVKEGEIFKEASEDFNVRWNKFINDFNKPPKTNSICEHTYES